MDTDTPALGVDYGLGQRQGTDTYHAWCKRCEWWSPGESSPSVSEARLFTHWRGAHVGRRRS